MKTPTTESKLPGTVLCIPGTGSGPKWTGTRTPAGKFVAVLRGRGCIVVVAKSTARKWSAKNSAANPDIKATLALLKSQGAKGPFYLVGHSAGGAFASRFAVFSGLQVVAVQYSNASGAEKILEHEAYTPRSLFCYSLADPYAPASKVLASIKILATRGATVETRDLTHDYDQPDPEKHHEFFNTSETTLSFFTKP